MSQPTIALASASRSVTSPGTTSTSKRDTPDRRANERASTRTFAFDRSASTSISRPPMKPVPPQTRIRLPASGPKSKPARKSSHGCSSDCTWALHAS